MYISQSRPESSKDVVGFPQLTQNNQPLTLLLSTIKCAISVGHEVFPGIRFDGNGVGPSCGRGAYLGFNVGWHITGNSELAPKVELALICGFAVIGLDLATENKNSRRNCFVNNMIPQKQTIIE